jgi:hypothetical protein
MSRTPDEEILLRHIPNNGETIGNLKLRKLLCWSTERYTATRDRLIDKAIIASGRGRGGSVYKLVAEKPTRRPRYAAQTTVPTSQSRDEIDKLLEKWGCKGIQWTSNFESGETLLRFAWEYQENTYMARLLLKVSGQQEFRILLLWLKAAFNAVDAGIIKAEEIFLPFLESRNGQTVGEMITKQLPALLTTNPSRLLEQGR